MNLDADVLVWDEYEGMDDITTDGQYHLVINKNSFEFYKEGRERILEIFADHPKGWEVLTADLPGWIYLNPQDYDGQALGPMTGKMDVSITLDPIDPAITDPNYTREGFFTITSGVMKKKVYIKQINQPELTIDVFPNTLIFRKAASSPKSIQVTVYPASSVVHFSEISGIHPVLWRPGGFPITGLANLGSYSFQPDVNNSTDLLSATITIYIQSTDGSMASKTVTISQLATNMLFNITNKPMTYPALGGAALSFTVESDTPWQLSTDLASDPHGMLTLSDTNELPKTTPGTVPYLFSLTPNPYYDTERIANIYAKSSDRDFYQQEIEIKQAFQAPTLKLNDLAANAIVDLGTPIDNTTQMTVKVTTNAGWVTLLNPNYLNVLAGWVPGLTLVQTGSTMPTQEVSENITIGSYANVIGMPAAGTEVSENFTIETRNHGTAPMVSRVVTVKRKIQAVWSPGTYIAPAPGSSLAYSGQYVSLSANTNMQWWMGSNVAAQITTAAAPYAENAAMTILIPANTTWTNPRTVTVSSIWHGAPLVDRVSYTQPGYYVTGATSSTVTAAGGGGITVWLSGYRPDIRVRLLVDGEEQWAAIVPGGTGTNAADLHVPSNPTTAARSIVIQGILDGTNYHNINSWTQEGIHPGTNMNGVWVSSWYRNYYDKAKPHCTNHGFGARLPTAAEYKQMFNNSWAAFTQSTIAAGVNNVISGPNYGGAGLWINSDTTRFDAQYEERWNATLIYPMMSTSFAYRCVYP